eukprot:CAMPEP_0206438680 /NCGR_PEP_ID=MMETSP0324_2-20121206/11780_1 /ASSEMBLY_ACC=CAM_ASM_000836 /TAXON_ID=2866 /ORGANISM="Crypthecodinium cohnii, Strain Seligo" /LENGTH=128 /DNA_ID=CAMNT_0053906197 /DNA_START=468 /DNA_END=852 /DNA_ORIENTATION=+
MVGSGASCGRRGCGGGLELDLCLEVCNPLHVVQALALDPFADEAPPSTLPWQAHRSGPPRLVSAFGRQHSLQRLTGERHEQVAPDEAGDLLETQDYYTISSGEHSSLHRPTAIVLFQDVYDPKEVHFL